MDGGDTCQRTGFVESILRFRDYFGISNEEFFTASGWSFQDAWPTLLTPQGQKLIRNPRPGDSIPAWNDPSDTSRDQTDPMIIAFGLNHMRGQVDLIRPKMQWYGLYKYQNADIAAPSHLSTIDRALGLEPLLIGDLWANLAIRHWCREASKDLDNVGDDLNYLLHAVFCYVVKPTKISKATLKYYLQNRPHNLGTNWVMEKYNVEDNVLAALMWYFRESSGGNPDIAHL